MDAALGICARECLRHLGSMSLRGNHHNFVATVEPRDNAVLGELQGGHCASVWIPCNQFNPLRLRDGRLFPD